MRTFSHGGGWQSTAALVLSAQGRIDFPVHLFANVGDDSEYPKTLAYVREVSTPYAAAHGVELIELHKLRQRGAGKVRCPASTATPEPGDFVADGRARCPSCQRVLDVADGTFGEHIRPETLYERLTRPGSRSLPIPVRMSNGAPGTRSCTMSYKLEVIARWHADHGATNEDPATVGIGFSTDELERVGNARQRENEVVEYPLIQLGLSRADCARVITDAGLPMPPKSSCWFCPMHRPSHWSEMRRDEPELFEKSVQLEALLNERRDELGKDHHVYFTRFAKPLREAIGEAQTPLFDADGWGETCDEGACFT